MSESYQNTNQIASYIPNQFGRDYVSANFVARRGVHTPLAFVDICLGNETAARAFAQIMYWHEPNKETGKTRLTKRDAEGNLWLEKHHDDWYAETRIKKRTAQRALTYLDDPDIDLIHYKTVGSKGKESPWIRVNWAEFERRMKIWLSREEQGLNDIPLADGENPYDIDLDPLDNLTMDSNETGQEDQSHSQLDQPTDDKLTSLHSQDDYSPLDDVTWGMDIVSISTISKTTPQSPLQQSPSITTHSETTTTDTAAVAANNLEETNLKDSSEKEKDLAEIEKRLAPGVADALRSVGVWKNNWHHAIGWPVDKVLAVIAASKHSDIKDRPGFIVYLIKKGCDVVPESQPTPEPDETSIDSIKARYADLLGNPSSEPTSEEDDFLSQLSTEEPTPTSMQYDLDEWSHEYQLRDAQLAIMNELQFQLAPAIYRTWVDGAKILGKKCGEQTIMVGVENTHIRNWLQERLQSYFERSVSRILRQPYTVEFVLLYEERVAC